MATDSMRPYTAWAQGLHTTTAMRIAAIGDLHCPRGRPGELARRLHGIAAHAQVLVLCGDLTDTGDQHEARALAQELRGVDVPMVGVLGNHDVERGETARLRDIFGDVGVHLLDGDALVLDGVGFAGTKGFGGGFGKRRVCAFGEEITKAFVAECEREAYKLEHALRTLETHIRVAVTHYAPILHTVSGEAPEIIPFLGSSDLGEAADAAAADLLVHGHAHFGRAEGRTARGAPVFNCAAPVLDRLRPPRRFALIEVMEEGARIAPEAGIGP
jgi:Icc-related predicted phosphoesterase